jgi:hypothetical protein
MHKLKTIHGKSSIRGVTEILGGGASDKNQPSTKAQALSEAE